MVTKNKKIEEEIVEEAIEDKIDKKQSKSLSASEIRDMINKKMGVKSAYNLGSDKPLEIKKWYMSGNRLLDSNVCEGRKGFIPQGLCVELSGQNSSGKSFLAICIAKDVIDQGGEVVYFVTEAGALEEEFVAKILGPERIKKFTLVEISYMEEIFENIETLLVNSTNEIVFFWDSYASTLAKAELEGSFDPSSTFAIGPRVATLGIKKLQMPLFKRGCSLVVLNQIRDNVGADKYQLMTEPFRVPGSKLMAHTYSLRFWIFPNNQKGKAITGSEDEKIGKTGTLFIKKSRFRTEGRSIKLAFEWAGDNPHFHDKELWYEALKERGFISRNKITFKDGTSAKVEDTQWMEYINNPINLKKVEDLLDEAFIYNYKPISSNIKLPDEELDI